MRILIYRGIPGAGKDHHIAEVQEAYGHKVEVLNLWVGPEVALGRQQHAVPEELVRRMWDTMKNERLMRRWRVQNIGGEAGAGWGKPHGNVP